MTELLCLLLKPALLCLTNPRRYFYLIPLVILAWIVDFILAHTFWYLIAGWPKNHEYTISDTLERLVKTPGPDQDLFIQIALKINRVDPAHSHIRSVKL